MLTQLFMICAVVGGGIALVQLFLSLMALGSGHTAHVHHQGAAQHGNAAHHGGAAHRPGLTHGGAAANTAPNAPAPAGKIHVPRPIRGRWEVAFLLGIFNFQSIVAGLAVLGLAGLAASAGKLPVLITLLIAGGSGLVMMVLVAMVLQAMVSMDDDGTVQVERAIGQVGTVYLSIPANAQGQGKITLSVQQRLMEFPAVTCQATALAAGDKVIVVAVKEHDLMEVVSAENYLRDVAPLNPGRPAP